MSLFDTDSSATNEAAVDRTILPYGNCIYIYLRGLAVIMKMSGQGKQNTITD